MLKKNARIEILAELEETREKERDRAKILIRLPTLNGQYIHNMYA